jgi:hypothetical protein
MIDAFVLTRMLHAVDARDFATARASFADEVHADYTSLWGGEAATVSGDVLIAGFRGIIPGFDATQHLTGPVITVDGQLETHVAAHHWLDGEVWVVHGHYVATVAGGKITGLTLVLHQQTGNLDLPARARARAAEAA